ENTPDFDSMSPEEIMAWMESLAKRQGASSEGFTTAADMEIAEIDPDTVVIDEPGYVPFGQEAPKKEEAAPPSAAAAPAQPEPEPAVAQEPEPEPAPEPEPVAAEVKPEPEPEPEPVVAEVEPEPPAQQPIAQT